jgi:hypothetical protein
MKAADTKQTKSVLRTRFSTPCSCLAHAPALFLRSSISTAIILRKMRRNNPQNSTGASLKKQLLLSPQKKTGKKEKRVLNTNLLTNRFSV